MKAAPFLFACLLLSGCAAPPAATVVPDEEVRALMARGRGGPGAGRDRLRPGDERAHLGPAQRGPEPAADAADRHVRRLAHQDGLRPYAAAARRRRKARPRRAAPALLPRPLPAYDNRPYDFSDLAGDERWRRLIRRIPLAHASGFANFRWVEPDRKPRFHVDPGARYGYSAEGKAIPHDERSRPSAAGSMDTTIEDQARMWAGIVRGEGLSAASRAMLVR